DEIVQKFVDQTPFPVVVEMRDSEGGLYRFEFPKVKATQAPVVAGGTGGDVVVDLSMQAIYDSDRGYTVLISGGDAAAPPPAPVITSLSPNSAAAGSAELTVTVIGTGFQSGDNVKVTYPTLGSTDEGLAVFVNDTTLTYQIRPASELAGAPSQVTVT